VRPAGWLRNRDARAVLLALLTILIGIATTPAARLPLVAAFILVAAVAAQAATRGVLRRSALVLLPAAILALAVVPARGWTVAGTLLLRAWLSAVAVLVTVETATATRLFSALARLGCPDALVVVLQFVYRFLFVLGDTARTMRTAALARGLQQARRGRAFTAAAGIVAMLFAGAHGRATRIHRAMVGRGYRGQMPSLTRQKVRFADAALVIGTIALVLTIRSHQWPR
jgi:cobalt/nickel transport system permease protein